MDLHRPQPSHHLEMKLGAALVAALVDRPLTIRRQGVHLPGYPTHILLQARRIDNEQIALLAELVHGKIIDDAATIRAHDRVCQLPELHCLQIAGQQMLQEREAVGPAKVDLSHVRDIEKTCITAHKEMFLPNAAFVLNWHLPAGERDDSSPLLEMNVVERRPPHWGGPSSSQTLSHESLPAAFF